MKQKTKILIALLLLILLSVFPAQAAEAAQINNISDVAGLLTEEEWEELERQARSMSEQYDFGIYAIAVDNYEAFVYGDVNDAAEMLYEEYTLGEGEDRDGLLLLLSMAERGYSLHVNGDFGEYAFTDYGREEMVDFFLDDFGDDDWYGGFSDYLEWCENYLETAKNGDPFSEEYPPMDDSGRIKALLSRLAVILLLPLAVAGIAILTLNSKMKSVAIATQASTYIKGNLILAGNQDRYTHTTETRQKVKSEGSGGSSKSSGGSTSGKF